jgi:hypothetical protein
VLLHQPLDRLLKGGRIKPLLAPDSFHEFTEIASRYDAFDWKDGWCHVKVLVDAGVNIHPKCSKHDGYKSVTS